MEIPRTRGRALTNAPDGSAPIALYPDSLVGQILAASQYPTQIVEAQRWMETNSGLSAAQVAQGANSQSWDPSVKSLTAFPKGLNDMNTNLSWTSVLGEAYYSDPQGVLQAVQVMRAQAKAAGTLSSTSQQTVETQGETIIIQPADPQVIYVPQYNPTVPNGAPVGAYPGYTSSDLALTGVLAFGAGVAVGALINSSDGWGCRRARWSQGLHRRWQDDRRFRGARLYSEIPIIGVMTFLVDAGGIVMQKDLGLKTSELAEAIDSNNPDSSWELVQ